jgi:hypothetical protein
VQSTRKSIENQIKILADTSEANFPTRQKDYFEFVKTKTNEVRDLKYKEFTPS